MPNTSKALNRDLAAMNITLEEIPKDGAVLFGATWCEPCKAIKVKLAADSIDYNYIEVDDCIPQVRADYNVKSVPTLVVFAGGEEVERRSGQSILDFYLDKTPKDA